MTAKENITHGFLSRLLSSYSGASSLLTLARLAGAGVGFLLQIAIARYAGAQVLGQYYIALSLTAILSVFLSLGYPWIIAPIISSTVNNQNPELMGRFLKAVKRDAAIATITVAIPIGLLIWLYPDISHSQRTTMLVGVATAPVYVWMRMNGGIANALRYFQVANLPELLLRPLIVLIFTGFLIVLSIELTPIKIVSINLIAVVILSLWMARFLPTYPTRSMEKSGTDLTLQEAAEWRKLALPMMFPALFIFLFADLDIFLIGMMMPTGEAGIFGVCIKIAALFAFAVQIAHQILLRDISDAHEARDKKLFRSVVQRSNKYSMMVSIASLMILLALGQTMLGIFGPEFTAGYQCLLLLGVAQIIRAAAGPAIQILMTTGDQRAGIPVYALSILVLLVSNFLLVPAYGLIGAALSVNITFLFCSLWLNGLVKQTTGYSVSIMGSRL